VHEHIGPILAPDETVTFRVIEPLYRTLHMFHLRASANRHAHLSPCVSAPFSLILMPIFTECQEFPLGKKPVRSEFRIGGDDDRARANRRRSCRPEWFR
jgi:hypothetical protein